VWLTLLRCRFVPFLAPNPGDATAVYAHTRTHTHTHTHAVTSAETSAQKEKYLYLVYFYIQATFTFGWLGGRVVSVLDSGAEGPGFKSQPRRCLVTVLGKLFTPVVPLFTKQ